jgi:5-methyltetrahydropteroyltriglutamate--homocysteine methyltransferase
VARGRGDDLPLEMTKWFDTNYHYLVPEIGPETEFRYVGTRPVAEFVEALADGVVTRPVLVGPVTYLALAKATEGAPADFLPIDRLPDLLPVYADLLRDLAAAGATWVQLEEPALVSESIDVPVERLLAATVEAYRALATELARPQRPAIFVAAPYGDLDAALPVLAATDVEAIGLDLVKGSVPTEAVPGLATKTLVAGVIDGHNIWRADLDAKLQVLEQLEVLGAAAVTVGTSTSLFHVPHDTADEPNLDATLKTWLAFADQKVAEVVTLAEGLAEGREAIHEQLLEASDAVASRKGAPGVVRPEVRERTAGLTEDAFNRGPFDERKEAQTARLNLPPLPTTTIGSFPQTPEIRKARAAHGKGELTDEQYVEEMKAEIRRVVELQERIGLDVLVHGEPERNDMVQYFAENLDGFAVTENGWVQSYGSRCTRPSILWGDVSRPKPITVDWTTYTQSLTEKPVKGMLTGPVTMLQWSFVRDDQSRSETCEQLALAIRDEVADLEAQEAKVIQVDEPAIREGLPLRRDRWDEYLRWAVYCFRVATAVVRDETQIHTHMCYSDFGDIMEQIQQMDADVLLIEAARSRMELLHDWERTGYPQEIGPGVYDIHSPRVPPAEEMAELLEAAARVLPPEQLWVNPDCGLKTRGWPETEAALRNLVQAAKQLRKQLVPATE